MKAPPVPANHPVGTVVPWIVGGVAMAAGATVVAGWLLRIPVLTSLIPGTGTMKVNAALAFIFGGGALWFLQMSGAWARYAARFCALVIGGIALCALVECVSDWNSGIDELLVCDIAARGDAGRPGCMALNEAAGFLLVAVALWLMGCAARRVCRPWVLAILGVCVVGIGFVALLGYLAGFRAGYSWWNDVPMPLSTALLFILLGGGVLHFAWRKEGIRWWIGPRITLGFICVLVVLAVLAANANRRMNDVVTATVLVRHTQDVIDHLHELQRYLDETQSAVRGFMITGDDAFLPLFDKAIPETRKCLAELREMMAHDSRQRERFSVLEKRVAERLAFSQQQIESRRRSGFDVAEQTGIARREKALMDQIRTDLGEMAADEARSLAQGEAQAGALISRTFSILPAGVLLGVLALTISLLRLNRETAKRQSGAEALREASQKLRLHFERTPMAVIEWDLDFRVTSWNPAARKIFGYKRSEALGQHASFIVPAICSHHVDELWHALSTQSGGERSTNQNVRKDGKLIFCEWYNTPLIDDQGIFTGAASLVLDITERRQTLELLAWEKSALELIGSAASLREVLNGLMLGLEQQLPGAFVSICLLDDDGIHLRHGAAPSLPDAYNHAVDSIVIGPTAGPCGTAVYLNRQVIVEDIDSDPLWVDFRAQALEYGLRACWSTPIHGSEGKILGAFAVYFREPREPAPVELDLLARAERITRIAIERKQAEENVRKLRVALDEHAIVSMTNARGKITYANDKFCVISKYARDELLGRDHRIIKSGHHPKTYMKNLWQTINGGSVWKGEFKNRAKDGSFYWVNSTIVPFFDQDGKPAQFVAIRTDITERKQAEAALRLKNLVFDVSIAANGIADVNGCMTEVNDAFLYLWGYPDKREVVGLCIPDFFRDAHDAEAVLAALNGVGQWEGDFNAKRKDGSIFIAHGLATSVKDENGQVIGYQSAFMDLTERRQAEDEIRQLNTRLDQRVSERTAQLQAVVNELDAFSYSVSHDLRAPLRAVDGFSRILVDDYALQLDENGLRILGVIRSETQRMGQLIDDLLAFSRLGRQPMGQEQIDMQALAQAVFDELAAHETGRQLRLDLHPLPPARGTRAMIRQVWVNLIGNAIKFTQGREVGTIEIGARDGENGVPVYYVKDNGAGFDMRYADKLFGVFQRLHSQQEFAGTGVGLALVQRIVQRHGGRVWADAEVQHGATFYFTLPNP